MLSILQTRKELVFIIFMTQSSIRIVRNNLRTAEEVMPFEEARAV